MYTIKGMDTTRLTRRALLINAAASAVGALLAACGTSAVDGEQQATSDEVTLTVSAQPTRDAPFRTDEFSMVGVFDVDWLADPSFTGLLDNLAASPGAFTAVRFFGALNSGTLEKTTPTEGSEFGVRSRERRTPNSALLPATFAALEALTSRGLIPFVQLSFFPPDVSPSPTLPPASFDGWQALRARLPRCTGGGPALRAGGDPHLVVRGLERAEYPRLLAGHIRPLPGFVPRHLGRRACERLPDPSRWPRPRLPARQRRPKRRARR